VRITVTELQFSHMPIDDFLAAAASKEPVPGGGGIAALTAASAAALVEMVANLTIGKKGYEDVERIMVQIRDQAAALRQRYLRGIAEDAAAFDAVIQAVRLPKTTEKRSEHVQAAFKRAASIPFSLGQDIFQLLQLSEQAVQFGNEWVITDGAIAAMNARAAMRSAFYSVRVNLHSIRDEAFVTEMMKAITATEEKAVLIEQSVERKYHERCGS
jgi:formiminotetrahydrofolate cyclodeaminase